MLANANTAIKTACEEQGISYVYDNGVDPNWAEKIKGSQKYIKEAVARLELNDKIEGSDVALFSTDSSVQSTIVDITNKKGFIYVSPSFPTAYNGLGEHFEIAMPEDTSDINAYVENAKAAVAADKEGKGRFAIYSYPLATTLVKSAVHCTFDILNGTTTAENMAEKVTMRVTDASINDTLTVKVYDEKLTNVFAAYSDGYVTIK
jgi:hypothetical protein